MNTLAQADNYFPFDNSYARLPDRFFARLAPTPVSAPRLIRLNTPLAHSLGLDPAILSSPQGIEILAGNLVPDGAEPLAMAYAGHQFGNWVPQLGDGRAILLGEVIDAGGARHDIQLKGAGRTPFSRGGDGRAALGPILREFIISEAMAALGIPTTRALAAVTTGEPVIRETRLPGAVLTRVAKCHIRIGTFQYFAARDDVDALRILGDHVISRLYPDIAGAQNPYLALLEQVIARQADLVARWMHVGFIHGVMNTDNMSIAGETIDYGPCAFMDTYQSDTVFSSIDQMGRYAYGNQPQIAHWNLVCLAQTLIPLLGDSQEAAIEAAQEAVNRFPEQYEAAWLKGMRKKLGLTDACDNDLELAQDLLNTMAGHGADFTKTFRQLYNLVDKSVDTGKRPNQSVFDNNDAPGDWECRWWQRLENEACERGDQVAVMQAANPAFIPRNHLVEEAISAALNEDFDPFESLMSVLSRPYEDQPDRQRYAIPPTPDKVVHQTFCGT